MENTIFISMPVSELKEMISETVGACLQNSKSETKEDTEEILTAKETCALLKITKTTLWKRTNDRVLQSYGQGSRVYYKKSEVLASLVPLKK